MILKTNPYPAELLLRLYGSMGRKPIHPKEGPDVAELIKTVQKESRFQLEQRGMEMACHIPEHIVLILP